MTNIVNPIWLNVPKELYFQKNVFIVHLITYPLLKNLNWLNDILT
jgi:hypothetical protein